MIKTINLKRLIKCLAIPQILGIIAGLLTQNSKVVYAMLNKPPLAPPSWLFPVVWTLLYIFIGIADYIGTGETKPICKKARALWPSVRKDTWPVLFAKGELYCFAVIFG